MTTRKLSRWNVLSVTALLLLFMLLSYAAFPKGYSEFLDRIMVKGFDVSKVDQSTYMMSNTATLEQYTILSNKLFAFPGQKNSPPTPYELRYIGNGTCRFTITPDRIIEISNDDYNEFLNANVKYVGDAPSRTILCIKDDFAFIGSIRVDSPTPVDGTSLTGIFAPLTWTKFGGAQQEITKGNYTGRVFAYELNTVDKFEDPAKKLHIALTGTIILVCLFVLIRQIFNRSRRSLYKKMNRYGIDEDEMDKQLKTAVRVGFGEYYTDDWIVNIHLFGSKVSKRNTGRADEKE